ncbi:TPA: hypothetical protein NJ013_004548, partial [Vibrio parahaemolyticus]|nr:hypothetical protein [Vibrio parahaemolyticus]
MAIPRYKDIVELIKKGSTIEAQEKIMELREAALELQEENFGLKEELSQLKREVSNRKAMIFKGGIYWKQLEDGTEDGPFCPKCLDTGNKSVRMHKDGDGWWCYTCSLDFGTNSDYA